MSGRRRQEIGREGLQSEPLGFQWSESAGAGDKAEKLKSKAQQKAGAALVRREVGC